MKALFKNVGLFSSLFLIAFSACKKNENVFDPQTELATKKTAYVYKVSDKGMLRFSNKTEVRTYVKYLQAQTQEHLAVDMAANHFTPMRAAQKTPNDKIQADDFLASMLNRDGLVQLGNKIIKPIFSDNNGMGNVDFVYMVDAGNEAAFTKIKNAKAGNSSLKKYSATEFSNEMRALGFSDNPNLIKNLQNAKFWGWGSWSDGSCDQLGQNQWIDQNGDGIGDPTYWRCRNRTYYVLGIPVDTQTDCYLAYGCSATTV